jgi:hypothetical protein
MTKIVKIVLSVVLLAGCATQAREMRGPSGKRAFSISCKRGIENCYQAASDRCPAGYDLVSAGQKTKGYVSTGYAVLPVSQDNIFVECK